MISASVWRSTVVARWLFGNAAAFNCVRLEGTYSRRRRLQYIRRQEEITNKKGEPHEFLWQAFV